MPATEPETSPKQLIEDALRRYRRLALAHRWGGLAEDYRLAKQALDALENLTEARQLSLFEEGRCIGD